MLFSPPLTKEALKGLSQYKKSPISKYILSPYWTYCATFFPIWMVLLSLNISPNLITFLGFVFVLLNFIILLYYTPDLETPGKSHALTAPAPSWVYFSFGIGLFVYSTFDNVDGKQARRTGSSSPLGEVFDHGVDALNCTTGGLLQAAGLGLGLSVYTPLTIAIAASCFFISTWETYYTGTLYLGEFNGPTEGLLISIGSLFISGVYGPGFWKTPLSVYIMQISPYITFLDKLPVAVSELQIGHFAVLVMALLLIIIQIPGCLYRVYMHLSVLKKPFGPALANLIPYLILGSSCVVWILNGTVVPGSVIVFTLAFGVVMARVNALIVVCHVTHTPYPTYFFLIAPFVVGALISSFYTFGKLEETYIWAITLFIIVEYVVWCVGVVECMCKELGIKCFVIPYPGDGKKEKKGKVESVRNEEVTVRRVSPRIASPRKL